MFFGLAAANIHLPQQNKWAVYLSFGSFRLLFLLFITSSTFFYIFDFISNGTCLVFTQHCRKTKKYLLFRCFIFLQSSKFRFCVRPRLYRLVGENNLRPLKQMLAFYFTKSFNFFKIDIYFYCCCLFIAVALVFLSSSSIF